MALKNIRVKQEFYKPLSGLHILIAALLVLEMVMQKTFLVTIFILAIAIEWY